ncbi:juvenile hormone esterase [Bactrocera neohumeralis]|uniref:juvenile hormone esterase n=1 Tax=Bactrocera neohumeralis TaxID=98809 RepID=UPI0021650035|nr:juvenile hormone esterase [Bactrocera neohumeralis]
MFALLFVLVANYFNFSVTKAGGPEVCIDQLGCIEGVYATGSEGQEYEAFYGIPFAKPPIGELRFKNPLPVEPWNDKRMAKEPRTECIQYNQIPRIPTISGEEDCLYLNLYRPKKWSTEKLPILFYIHGGGFFSGTPSPAVYGPEYFMETNEVILVLAAYRLGQFGFLSTGDEHMTGNFGLKDQNIALKWVQKYIAAFNGDPSRVTIFGHSAGSFSVHFHMLSPASKGLFRNAVLMSGHANCPFLRQIDQKSQVIQLAKGVGITNVNEMSSRELADALRNVPATDLLKAGVDLKVWSVYPFGTFRTTIEQESWPEPFITEDMFKLIGSPKMPKTVPWIGGYTSSIGEGTVLALRLSTDPDLQAHFNKNFNDLFKLVMELNGTTYLERVDEVIERLVVEYMGGVRELNKDTIDGFLELLGDYFFTYPLYKTIASNVYSDGRANSLTGIIKFGYRGPNTFTEIFTGSSRNVGAVHVDDLLYLYRMPFLVPNGYEKSTPERELVKKYVELHVEYAKTGIVEAFNKMSPCSKDKFDRPDGAAICDYLSIVNDTELFQVENKWNVKRMKLWEYLDKTLFDI